MKIRYILYIILLLPVFIFRDYTPANELKYISIIEEAIENGTWFTFYNHGEIYADKPPLYFWLLMLGRLITGGYHMWLMGLFSLLPAVGILGIMSKWLREDQTPAFNPVVPELMLLTTGMFLGSALVLRMDILMIFFMVLALYTFFRIYKRQNKPREKWLLPVYIFLAIFSKGAMGLLVPVVTPVVYLLLKKDIRQFGRCFGIKQWGILIGLCALWFGAIYLEGGNEYLNNILFKQTVGRGVNSFHHKEPFWYYIPRVFFTFAPWSLLYIVVMWHGVRKGFFGSEAQQFFLTTVWVNFLMLSLISSKIDIYLLPIYPFVVYLVYSVLYKTGNNLASKIALTVPFVIFILFYPASFLVKGAIPYEYDSLALARIGLFVLTLSNIAALVFVWRHKASRALAFSAGGVLFLIFISSFSLPQFNKYFGFRQITYDAMQYANDNNIDNYTYFRFYTAPNMDAYLGVEPAAVHSVEGLDSLDNLPHRSILFVREKDKVRDPEFRSWVEQREQLGRTGKYSWFVVGGLPNKTGLDEISSDITDDELQSE